MWEVVIVVGGTNQWDATSCLVVMRAIRNVQWAGDRNDKILDCAVRPCERMIGSTCLLYRGIKVQAKDASLGSCGAT